MKATLLIAIAILGASAISAAASDTVRIVLEWPSGSKTPSHAWTWGNGDPAHLVVSEHRPGSNFENVPRSWDVQVEVKKGLAHPRLRVTHIAGDRVEVEIRFVVSGSETTTIWLTPNFSYELNGESEVFVRVVPRRKPPQADNTMQHAPALGTGRVAR